MAAVLDAAPDAMIVVGLDGRIRLVNLQVETLFRYRRDELLGQPVELLIPKRYAHAHPDFRDGYVRNPVRRPMAAGLKLFGLRKDGSEVPVEISLAPVETVDGPFIISAIRDISDRMRLESSLQRQNEEQQVLTRALRRKDEFLATLAHELRNPLAPIRYALEALHTNGVMAAHARAVIERQVAQLVRLVEDLVDVSRLTTNKIRLRREPVRLAQMMSVAAETAEPSARAADHQIIIDLPPPDVWIDGDATRLVQVFSNILNNAIKFTPRGGTIRFTAVSADSQAVIRVADTGIGIAPTAMTHIFEMFHQEDVVTDRGHGGLGIGLTLAHRFVEMHDGQITVESPGLGGGTTVTIMLPTTLARPTDSVAALDFRQRPLRVEVVDDNVDTAEMLAFLVTELGHEAKIAHDGRAALLLAEEFCPDVILLDIGLPIMSGYEVAMDLRQRPGLQDVYLAALTGWGQPEDRRRARESGFDTHFTKPVEPSAIANLLNTVAHGMRQPPRTRMGDNQIP